MISGDIYMLPGINPRQLRQMQKMMKQMGMNELDVKQVIFLMKNKRLVIKEPQVVKVNMMGQEVYQVSGMAEELPLEQEATESMEISEEDIDIVVEQTGVSREKARDALKKTGDLAEAIMILQGN